MWVCEIGRVLEVALWEYGGYYDDSGTSEVEEKRAQGNLRERGMAVESRSVVISVPDI